MGRESTHWRFGARGSKRGHKQSGGLFVSGERLADNAWAVVDRMRRPVRHAPGPTRWEQAAPLAKEGNSSHRARFPFSHNSDLTLPWSAERTA